MTPKCLADLGQRIRGVDARVEPPRRHPIQHLSHVGAVAGRIALHRLAPEHADGLAAFEQQEVERDFRNVAGGKADDEETALPAGCAQCRLGGIAADAVVDDVDAATAGQPAQTFLEIVGAVVDRLVGAVLARHRKLLRRGSNGNDARAHQLGDLHRGKTGAAGGAEHGHRLARLQMPAVFEAVDGGAIRHRHAGGDRVADTVGNGDQRLHLGDDLLARPAPAEVGHHPVADLHVARRPAPTPRRHRRPRPTAKTAAPALPGICRA